MPIEFINPNSLSASPHYTQVVVTPSETRTIYISGQLAVGQDGQVVGIGDFAAQTKQVYENLRLALHAVGATFTDIVKTTIYVVDNDADKSRLFREIRSQYQTGPNPPASTFISVQGLAHPGFMLEIDAIAAL